MADDNNEVKIILQYAILITWLKNYWCSNQCAKSCEGVNN